MIDFYVSKRIGLRAVALGLLVARCVERHYRFNFELRTGQNP